MVRPEDTGSRLESGEAIVVGTIGSAAPWFLTGWAHDVEIEFMIDTGCQVTILSTMVFQRMCTVNPAVRSALQPCHHQLVSAESSPLRLYANSGSFMSSTSWKLIAVNILLNYQYLIQNRSF